MPAEYVTTEEGTGLVHLAPAFGEVDRQIGRANGLPSLNPVGPDGRFTADIEWLADRDVREANHDINDRLEAAGLLIRRAPYVHSYPHCWRCRTPLIYWGKPSWYIATSTRKDALLAANATVDWHPAYIRDGRFGEWLANNVDWALSRDRYWGTPLPIWRCGRGHLRCVGSLAELSDLCGRDVTGIDPHRPTIDEVTFVCSTCTAEGKDDELALARRVEPVIDAWFDSGSMPAAQVGYPHSPGSADAFVFPADFISEAIDQTRGWFYSLLAINVIVFGGSPYRHVVCLGHVVDADGRKMSKSLGNIIDPWQILDTRGADAMRWWMFSQGSPWTPTRATLGAIDTAMRDMLLTLWNTFSFFTTYASLNGFDPDDPTVPAPAERSPLDRWILSRLASTTAAVTVALETYEPLNAATALADLVDDLSNWYVRRSRRRFWRTDPDAPAGDTLAAQATLHTVLTRLSLLLAPLCPFVADTMWRALTRAGADGSVHLADWPAAETAQVDGELEAQMALARRLTSLGRAARGEAGVKVRQPLSRALVFLPPDAPGILRDIVADELNVDEIDTGDELSDVLTFELAANFKTLGPRLGEKGKELKPALAALDGATAASALEQGHPLSVTLGGELVELSPEDVTLRVRGQPGFAVSREGGEVVALDLTLDDGLRKRGIAREVVRLVQDLRKTSGLEVSDRIRLYVEGLDAVAEHFDYIAREVLAVEIVAGPGPGGMEGAVVELDDELLAQPVRIWIEKVVGTARLAAGVEHLRQHAHQVGAVGHVEVGHQVALDPVDMGRHRPLENRPPLGCQDDMDAAPVARAVLPFHQPGVDHAVDEPGHATRGERDIGAEPAHGQASLRRSRHVDEHVEEDQRDPDGPLQLSAERLCEAAVGADDQAHELDALVVHLAEDPAGASVVVRPGPLLVAALGWNGRRSHAAQSLPKSLRSPSFAA